MAPTFYFINSMRTISSITEEKNWQKSMATFLANEVNATEGDITGPTEQSPNYVFFKGENNTRYLKTFFLGRR